MTDSSLTIQDLQARGWTLGMIRALLNPHDHQRWTNKRGQQMPRATKLYLEARVVQIEATEAFAHAQERAHDHRVVMLKAVQTRQAFDARALARYEALDLPAVQVDWDELGGHAAAAYQKELLKLHVQEFYLWQREQEHLLSGLTQAVRRTAEQRMFERYRAAVYQVYGWVESAK